MANDFTGAVWKIDTAYSTTPSAGHIVNSQIRVKSITWNTMAAGATLSIVDRNGRVLMSATDANANTPIVLGNFEWVEGFFVPTLSSGILSVSIGFK